MKRLPGIIFITVASLIVIVALLVSGLRLILPQLNHYRVPLLSYIHKVTDVPINFDFIQGQWKPFGPQLELHNIHITLPQGQLKVERLTVALDVWKSLLYWRWQFRDLTFYRLDLKLAKLPTNENSDTSSALAHLRDLFLNQLNYFDLRDSRVSFLAPSGVRTTFNIPKMTWLNGPKRHRAEGLISLSSFHEQHGVMQLRMDLSDNDGYLSNGKIYIQADNVDAKPWVSQWLHNNSGLQNARVNLAAWLQVQGHEINHVDLQLKRAAANWHDGTSKHQLNINQLLLTLNKQQNGWLLTIPKLNLKIDNQPWKTNYLALLFLLKEESNQLAELRIRTNNIVLERIEPLFSLFSFLIPRSIVDWQEIKPQGLLNTFSADLPLAQLEKSRFQAHWQNISWLQHDQWPSINHFSGALSGSIAHGLLDFNLHDSQLVFKDTFAQPLEIKQASGKINWLYDDKKGWELNGQKLDIQAQSLWANGDFHYKHLAAEEPWLSILAGIRLDDAKQAWRYFPHTLMSEHLITYLTNALQGGKADNATLVFAGNPQHFPFQNHNGQFNVFVPLQNATFQFQPDWPALSNFAINLDFSNDGLWMLAPALKLGQASAKNVRAVIAKYHDEKLNIDADIAGSGTQIHDYFKQTPLKNSLASTLEQLQIGGNVSGRLHLTIPFNHQPVIAQGEVKLNKNSVLIHAIDSQLEKVSGTFRFHNGTLDSDELTANWFGQPIKLNFTTQEEKQQYQVHVGLQGEWPLKNLPMIPAQIAHELTGQIPWQGKVAINLPHNGTPNYQIDLTSDLKEVSSHLPPPFEKNSGEALPIHIKAKGGLKRLILDGNIATHHFVSEWLLNNNHVTLTRAALTEQLPELPEENTIILNLPAIDGTTWLTFLTPLMDKAPRNAFHFPKNISLTTPQLSLGGQFWRNLALTMHSAFNQTEISATAEEIKGTLTIPANGLWNADLQYLYYNPYVNDKNANITQLIPPSFRRWPSLGLRCASCWLFGQNLGKIEFEMINSGDVLSLNHGAIDTGKGKLTLNGEWKQNNQQEYTTLKGNVAGAQLDDTVNYLGMDIPLKEASYNVDFDLNWQGLPWVPKLNTLNGQLKLALGEGKIDNINSGRAGQLLRLISFDALIRKLRLDFRDTFSSSFYFNAIHSTANIKDGIMHTEDLLINGLEGKIAINGNIDLVRRQLDMNATVAPEISTTVGVTTAFVVNPLVGVAAFVASRILAPLWQKVSIIRYHIGGNFELPNVNKVDEISRKQQENKAP